MGLEKRDERGRAAFFFAFKKKGDFARPCAVDCFPGAAGFDKGHQLAFVIGGSAAADDLALGRVFQCRVERVAVPQVERIDRLDVVVAVKQKMRRAVADVADNHRVAGCFVGLGGNTQCGQVVDQPVGGFLAIVGIGWIGRNRRDAQKAEQALDGCVEVGVEAGENGFKGHGRAPAEGFARG